MVQTETGGAERKREIVGGTESQQPAGTPIVRRLVPRRTPETDGVVIARAGEGLAIVREGQVRAKPVVPSQYGHDAPSRHMAELDGGVGVRHGQRLAVRG